MKINLKNYTFAELENLIKGIGFEKYRAGQLFHEIYAMRRKSFAEMTTLPEAIRNKLDEEYTLSSFENVLVRVSADGSQKFLFELPDKKAIEAVHMPWLDEDGDIERYTICISSMAGCSVGCAFCATGTLGFKRNLDTAEIIDQILYVENELNVKINNIVFMGMGEPLLNYTAVEKALEILTDDRSKLFSRRKITVSTSGVSPRIKQLAKIKKPVKLAISLHATTNGSRESIMPIAKSFNLRSLMDSVEFYYRETKMPVTYEYIPFLGINDTDADAKRLAKIALRVPSRINLIPFNDISFTNPVGMAKNLVPTPKPKIQDFAAKLRSYGVAVIVRDTFGDDIEAACGQLALSQEKQATV